MKKKLAKKIVESDLSDNNSFHDGITTPQGFTVGVNANNMGAIGTHSMSTRHQSVSKGTGLLGTGQPGTGQPITCQPGTGLPGIRQSITGQPGTEEPFTGHLLQAPVIVH